MMPTDAAIRDLWIALLIVFAKVMLCMAVALVAALVLAVLLTRDRL